MNKKYRLKALIFFAAMAACIVMGGFYGAKTLGLAIVVFLLVLYIVGQDLRALRKKNKKLTFLDAFGRSLDGLMAAWFR